MPAQDGLEPLAKLRARGVTTPVIRISGHGDVKTAMEAVRAGGGARVSWQVGSADEARAAQDAGCELVIAQGIEAGGHVRGTIGLLP